MSEFDDLQSDDEGARTPADLSDPAAVVLAHDRFVSADGIDAKAWGRTVFLPLVMLHQGGTEIVDSLDGFVDHMERVWETARAQGIAGLKTRILSHVQPREDMAILSTFRDRLDAMGNVMASTSITWTVIRTHLGWKINQIHFNDARFDPSIVTQLSEGGHGRE